MDDLGPVGLAPDIAVEETGQAEARRTVMSCHAEQRRKRYEQKGSFIGWRPARQAKYGFASQ